MSVASRNSTINWCPPIHHTVSGPTDPSNTILHSSFVVLIIGSSRGIGKGTALAYARAGASGIILTGRSQEGLQLAEAEVRGVAKHPQVDVLGVPCDVCSDEDLRQLSIKVKEHFGRLDVLVINAGVATKLVTRPDGSRDWPRDITELDLADFRRTFDVNFFGVVSSLKYLLPLVEAAGVRKEPKSGTDIERDGEWESPQSIIIVTSSAIHHYDPKLMAMGYALSKYSAARVSEFAHEGHKGKGVCTFAIQPGGVMTGETQKA